VQDDQLVGFLIVGSEVNGEIVKQVREVSGGDIAYWLRDANAMRLVATSLDEKEARLLTEAVKAREADIQAELTQGKGLERIDLAIGKRSFAAAGAAVRSARDAIGAVRP
jgi:hypothetical protein